MGGTTGAHPGLSKPARTQALALSGLVTASHRTGAVPPGEEKRPQQLTRKGSKHADMVANPAPQSSQPRGQQKPSLKHTPPALEHDSVQVSSCPRNALHTVAFPGLPPFDMMLSHVLPSIICAFDLSSTEETVASARTKNNKANEYACIVYSMVCFRAMDGVSVLVP